MMMIIIIMIRIVLSYFDNHSQFDVHAFVWRLFCAILTVIDKKGPGGANLAFFFGRRCRKTFFLGCRSCRALLNIPSNALIYPLRNCIAYFLQFKAECTLQWSEMMYTTYRCMKNAVPTSAE